MMLKIHFLNVGHGDCTVIEHESGRLTVVDINNGTDLDPTTSREVVKYFNVPMLSQWAMELEGANRIGLLEKAGYDIKLTNPVEFLKQCGRQTIFRYVQTHPDLDHMRGLVALRGAGFTVANFWDAKHDKTPDFQCESDEADWAEYEALASGHRGATVLKLYRGARAAYYSQDPTRMDGGDGIEILSPTPMLEASANGADNTNDLSYVLRVTYKGIKVILGGDAEQESWESIVGEYGDDLKCHVLKASHHGRDTGYYQQAVEAMSPQYTIVSVGRKPDTDASDKYRQYSGEVWSTRWRGNITLQVDDYGKGTISSQYNR